MPLDSTGFTKYGASILDEHMRRAQPHVAHNPNFIDSFDISTNDRFKVTSSKYNIDRDYESLYSAIHDLENIPHSQTIWHILPNGSKKVVYKRAA